MTTTNAPRRIGLIGYEDVAALDLVGVLDAFSIANWRSEPARYETVVVAASDAPFRAESGVRLLPDKTFDQAPSFDTLVVPGGSGLRDPEILAPVAAWLKSRATETRRMVSVCTGLYGLAAAGVMDGRRATTHWRHAAALARRYPAVRVEPDAIFIKDGPFYTSAGMTAGIDLALALIEEDHGPAHALRVARQMVVYMKRSGGQLQYSEPLRSQTRGGDRFADLIAHVIGDLGGDWSVEAMAARTGQSPRQFSRNFKTVFEASPAAYLDRLRLDEARLRLASGADSLARIAHAIGFRSDDAFRNAFERRFGVTPGVYRSRFASNAPLSPETEDETPRHV
jgi:transcriptional regulator GlxA family with amidase domain